MAGRAGRLSVRGSDLDGAQGVLFGPGAGPEVPPGAPGRGPGLPGGVPGITDPGRRAWLAEHARALVLAPVAPGLIGRWPGTAEEGAVMDVLAFGGRAPWHPSACGRDGCGHASIWHAHANRRRPCELCECAGIVSQAPRRARAEVAG